MSKPPILPSNSSATPVQPMFEAITMDTIKRWMVGWFKAKGWTMKDNLPRPLPSCIVIAAPHTSNWDFVYTMAVFFQLKIPVQFLAKEELFKGPLGGFMRSVGGIPVVRKRSTRMVDYIGDLFQQHHPLLLLMAAEGTRSRVDKWKTGFYHAALKANVPILCGYLDYQKKEGGFSELMHMSGDPEADAQQIKDFYRDKVGKHPQKFNVEGLVLR